MDGQFGIGVHSQQTGAVLVAEVNKRSGTDQRELAANLDYLVGTGHIEHLLQPIFGDRHPIPGIGRHYYRITSKGIDSMEHPSQFMMKPDAPNIAITTQNGVTIVGSHNTVSVGATDLPSLLKELNALVQTSQALAPELKSDVSADIQTIEAQIKKSKPNRETLTSAWKGIEGAVTAAEFGSVVAKIAEFIGSLM